MGFRQSKALLIRIGVLPLVLIGLGVGPISAGTGQDRLDDGRIRVAAIHRSRRPADVHRSRVTEPLPPRPVQRHVDVMRGDTLGSILSTAGLDAAEVARWTAAVKPAFDPRRIRVGRPITLEHAVDGRLSSLRYEIDSASTLVVERVGDTIAGRLETTPVVTELRGVAGIVERGLWTDVVAAGAPPAVASDLTSVFQGAVDFRRIAVGDEFRVLYEVHAERDGAGELPGEVVGAQIQVRGRTFTAIRFTDDDGKTNYYAPTGDALGQRGMLRYPVTYTRISSGFTHRRFHPILRRTRPHLGVDFAAPRGTPVRATVDGTVMLAGWKRGMGRMVRLRHAQSVETFYGHLSGIARGVRRGARVRQGQIIGYVGSTGLATGNHLHYGVRRNGAFVNPLALGSIPLPALTGGDRTAFATVRDTVTQELALLTEGRPAAVVSSITPAPSEG